MVLAWVLTLLALGGIGLGVYLGRSPALSPHLAAAGGGLLAGIAFFWVVPEIATNSGWVIAIALTLAAAVALAMLDHYLVHAGAAVRAGVIGPLLVATAVHAFLDGWSVRALSIDAVTGAAVLLGLALHKVPEGLALGWVVRRSFPEPWKAVTVAGGLEAFTLVGAFLEPQADYSGTERFGTWWTAAVLSVIGGSFLFLGLHTVTPTRRKQRILPIFLLTFLIVGGAAVVRERLGPV